MSTQTLSNSPVRAPTGGRSASRQRLDVQGLRMIAVLAVVADHLFRWPHGGFVGVDVFFVISGFLITGRLIRTAATSTFPRYLGQFYLLRVKRILPAALVVIGLTLVFANIIFKGARAHDSTVDGFFATVFAANWKFATTGTDYFAAAGPESPFQQYWSLAVEEQFYIFWPVILFAICWLFARLRRGLLSNRARLLVGGIVASMMCAASLSWGVRDSVANPTVAYFSTFSRGWELGVGALLACLLPLVRDIGPRPATILSWLGMILIGVSALVTSGGSGFPVPGAWLAVAGAAIAIAAGGTGSAPANPVLCNRGSVFIGDISYSIYLVHFPIIVFLQSVIGDNSVLLYVCSLCVTACAALLSYYFVENPFRFGRVNPKGSTAGARAAAAAFVCGAVALSAYALKPFPQVIDFGSERAMASSVHDTKPTVPLGLAGKSLRKQIMTALESDSFPVLKPGLSGLGHEAQTREIWSKCESTTAVPDACRYGDPQAKHRALVIGDSIAMSWIPAVARSLVPHRWYVLGFARGECPAAMVSMSSDELGQRAAHACDQWHRILPSVVRQTKPDLVIVSGSQNTLRQLADHSAGSAALDQYRSGLRSMLKRLNSDHDRLVFLSSPPQGGALLDCDTVGKSPSACVHQPDPTWRAFENTNRDVVTALGFKYVDTSSLFCVDTYCPSFVGHTPVQYDGTHMTKAYGQQIGALLTRALMAK